MENWYKISRSDAEVRDAFDRAWTGSNYLEDAILFLDTTGTNCFVSPGLAAVAKALLRAYGAVECSAPKRSEVSPLWAANGLGSIRFAPEA